MKTVERPWNVVFYASMLTAWPLIIMSLNTSVGSVGRQFVLLGAVPMCLSIFALANYNKKGW